MLEHPSGNEEDDDLDFDSSSGSDAGGRDLNFRKLRCWALLPDFVNLGLMGIRWLFCIPLCSKCRELPENQQASCPTH